jgi:hypothetical protein
MLPEATVLWFRTLDQQLARPHICAQKFRHLKSHQTRTRVSPVQPADAILTLPNSLLNQTINTKQTAEQETKRARGTADLPLLPPISPCFSIKKGIKLPVLVDRRVRQGRHSEPAQSLGHKEGSGSGPEGSGAAGGWQRRPRIPGASGSWIGATECGGRGFWPGGHSEAWSW